MFQKVRIAPSILSADFMHMARDVQAIEQGGAGFVHIDVMDGHFVPNLTIGVPYVAQVRKVTSLPIDVHLMIDNPAYELPWFIDAAPDSITVHYEAFAKEGRDEAIRTCIDMIHAANIDACLALKPDTPVSVLEPFIELLEMVLVMSVYPGFSGQSYIERSEDRIADVAAMAQVHHVAPLIQVDGGIEPSRTAGLVARAGADVLVAGSACFKGGDPAHAIAALSEAAEAYRLESN